MPVKAADEPASLDLLEDVVTALEAFPYHNASAIRSVRRQFSQRLAKSAPEAVLSLAYRLIHQGHAYRFIAYELIHFHRDTFDRLTASTLERLATGMADWSAVDDFACYLSGPAWREGLVSDQRVERWATSKNRWWRRAALVSTVPLNSKARGGSGDTQRTLRICKLLVSDRDDMVVKALSWALRELSKRDPETTQEFLQIHRALLAARVSREVSNKLSTGLTNPKSRN
jgi:3-methyladenine DNA glycosylase AlkD